MSQSEDESYDVELGPFFTAGVIVLVFGVLRRRPLAIAAGLGAIWLDQRSDLGRNLKKRIREAVTRRTEARDAVSDSEVGAPAARSS